MTPGHVWVLFYLSCYLACQMLLHNMRKKDNLTSFLKYFCYALNISLTLNEWSWSLLNNHKKFKSFVTFLRFYNFPFHIKAHENHAAFSCILQNDITSMHSMNRNHNERRINITLQIIAFYVILFHEIFMLQTFSKEIRTDQYSIA